MLYVKSSINFTLRNDSNMDTLENLCLELQKPRCGPFVVVAWYKLPYSPVGISPPLLQKSNFSIK